MLDSVIWYGRYNTGDSIIWGTVIHGGWWYNTGGSLYMGDGIRWVTLVYYGGRHNTGDSICGICQARLWPLKDNDIKQNCCPAFTGPPSAGMGAT